MRANAVIGFLVQVVLFSVCAVLFLWLSPVHIYAQEHTTQDNPTLGSEGSSVIPSDGTARGGGFEDVQGTTSPKVGMGDFSVTPVVANEKAKARDIIKKELVVTNNTGQRIDLYISVENIDPTQGAQKFVSPSASDLSTSLANWVEITRGVIELSAGESRKIPYLIHVNLSAKPGNYYARIQFQKGPKREEVVASEEGTALMLNVEVVDDAKERLQLGSFMSEDGVVFGGSVSFSYLLENVGNRLIEPRGSIRIFNRRGEEVGSIPLNAEGQEIDPDNKKQLAAVWNTSGRFGKYKAFLDLEYGENQLANVQDTVYFWIFPWKEIFVSMSGVLALALVGTYIVHMRAVATPVHAKSRVSYEPQEPEGRHQPFPISSSRVSKPIRAHDTPRRQPTHIALNAVTRGGMQQQPVRNIGSTIELAPRGAQRSVKTQGNVVQLSSRR